MSTYRIMVIASQARRVHSRRAMGSGEPRGVVHQPLPVLGQVVVGALLTLALAATYTAKSIFNAGGAIEPLAVIVALTALLAAGLLAGGGWRIAGGAREGCHGR